MTWIRTRWRAWRLSRHRARMTEADMRRALDDAIERYMRARD